MTTHNDTSPRSDRWTMTKRDCEEGWGKPVPDLIGPGLKVLFVGVNPSTCSGAVGLHFASPGNRFWPTLFAAGFTDRQLRPDERSELLKLGFGITNLVNRATAKADQVSDDELRAGISRLEALVRANGPRAVAILGRGAYRTAFGSPKVPWGRQDELLEGAERWILPNPSGISAYYQVPRLASMYRVLRGAVA